MLICGWAGFAAVAADIEFHGTLARWDHPIQVYFHENSSPALTRLFSGISGLGELIVILAVAGLVAALLIIRKRWRSLAVWATALIGSGIINPALKAIFRVPRPDRFTFYSFKPGSGYSFPSGHTMAVAITAGALALILAQHLQLSRRARWALAAAVILLSLLVAFALLYIGVHYLTDVLGGLAVSAGWLGVIWLLLPPRQAAKL